MNVLLLTTLISELCLAICVWCSPQILRWLAAYLLTRSDVIDACRNETERRMGFWRNELGLESEVQPERAAAVVQVR